jgi:anaerobic magnesium-protoporphyrin IX monomethyl ester cyclase
MVDILLIQPPIRDFYLTAKRTIPYGLASIAAGLIKTGFSVEILDALASPKSRTVNLPPEMSYLLPYYGRFDRSPFALFHNYKHFGYSYDTIGRRVKAAQPFLVGISSLFTAYATGAVKTAEVIKAHHPTCRIVVGGHHPTALPERMMESPAVDFVIRGEGEVSMTLLAKAIRSGTGYDKTPGLVFRRPDGSLQVGETTILDDLQKYPLPATRLLDRRFYRRNKKASAVIVASRGCPLKCTYCSMGSASPFSYRRRSIASVIAEIDKVADRAEIGFIDFEDENLSLDRTWLLQLLNAIRKHFRGHSPELRAMNGLLPSSLDAQIVRAMRAAGFKTLNLSLGTTAMAQLKRFQRPDVRCAFERALELAQSQGLQAVGYIIVGAPFQKATDSLKDLLYLAERRVLIGTSIFYPAPGSSDYALCASTGLLPKDFSCMRSSALPLSHVTTRTESVTLLRLSRIINFMKYLVDSERSIPDPEPAAAYIAHQNSRHETGKKLLQFFLNDGIIRGASRDGEVFEHDISIELSKKFLYRLRTLCIRGCQ